MPLLSISGLEKQFSLEAGFFARFGQFVKAVNGVSFGINNNEAYGLVGESGCGKTTTARLLVRMYEADGGTVVYHSENDPVDVRTLRVGGLRQYRQKVKYVFQDPARSLNPRMSVLDILTSGPRWSKPDTFQKKYGAGMLREMAERALVEVGLSAADIDRRPSEFSGGQRQRISIARSLLPRPDLLICDEVVSALDVSVQAQILNLLLDIREKRNMSFLFIAHDLKVACYFCDRIGVMYSGRLMEEAPAESLRRSGAHPYTQMLFAASTGINSNTNNGTRAAANVTGAKSGCAFAPRCPRAQGSCFTEEPAMRQVAEGHTVSCHFPA